MKANKLCIVTPRVNSAFYWKKSYLGLEFDVKHKTACNARSDHGDQMKLVKVASIAFIQ